MSRASASASLFVRWMREGRRELSDDDDDDDDEMEARRRRRDDDERSRDRSARVRAWSCVVARGASVERAVRRRRRVPRQGRVGDGMSRH